MRTELTLPLFTTTAEGGIYVPGFIVEAIN